ncbi:hypothetical protein ACJMK2_002883 [Sinanodonta woodiana]|uniref:Uncharacterized protein n=1 Tax=Sinanodonta woodiana TaxID=1069815 RepID=A0ABD3XWP2_SINWO
MYEANEDENFGEDEKGIRKERDQVVMNEKGENVMSILKGKNVNDVEKRRVREERLEVKSEPIKTTDNTVLKQRVKFYRKQENNNDERSRGMEIQSRLKELQQLQNSKIMLNVRGCKMETSSIKILTPSCESTESTIVV